MQGALTTRNDWNMTEKLTKSRQIFVAKLRNIVTFSSLLATYQDALMLQNCPQLNAHGLQWFITVTAALPDYSSVVSVNTIYGQPPATVQPYTLTYWCPLQSRAMYSAHLRITQTFNQQFSNSQSGSTTNYVAYRLWRIQWETVKINRRLYASRNRSVQLQS